MKQVLLFTLIAFSFQMVNAQDHKLELGLEGGPNQSGIYGSVAPGNTGPSYNYSFGFAAQYNINDLISIKASINYELKGYSQTFGFVTNPASQNPFVTYVSYTGLQYITMPILLKYNFGKRRMFFADAGPYFAYRVGTPLRYNYADTSGKRQTFYDNDHEQRNTIDLGFSAGIGVEKTLSNKLIFDIELRYNLGFLDADNLGSYSFQNESANLLVGLRYKI